jgi:hypothetical protein
MGTSAYGSSNILFGKRAATSNNLSGQRLLENAPLKRKRFFDMQFPGRQNEVGALTPKLYESHFQQGKESFSLIH